MNVDLIVQFGFDNRARVTLTAAQTEGRLLLSFLSYTGREYQFAFDYGRIRFMRLSTPAMREARTSQPLLERDFFGRWHMEREIEKAHFGEDFSFLPPPEMTIPALVEFAYTLLDRAYRKITEQNIHCGQKLNHLICSALAFNFQTLEAERLEGQALEADLPLILPPFSDARLCFPVMQGCLKRSIYGPCSFCDTFLNRPFSILTPSEILAYARRKIAWLAGRVKSSYEIFITEGDALAAPTQSVEILIRFLRKEFIDIPRLSAFASALSLNGDGKGIDGKSLAELQRLRQAGLRRIYLGVESGSDQVLQDMNKMVGQKEQLLAARKVRRAGLELACMIISGYGGREWYQEHLQGSVEFINKSQPDRVYFSRITPKPGTEYWSHHSTLSHTPLSRSEIEEWEKEVQRRVDGTVVFRQYTQLTQLN